MPNQSIESRLKARRRLVQQQVSGAEDEPEVHGAEFGEQASRLTESVSLRSWTLQMIEHRLPQRFALPDSITEPQQGAGNRGMVLHHNPSLPTGLQYTIGFSDALCRVRAVVHDSVGIHEIK